MSGTDRRPVLTTLLTVLGCLAMLWVEWVLSPVYQMAEAALLAPSEMISFVDSMVAPLSLINALLIAVGSRMRSDVSRTFAELEDIWNAYGVFGKMDDE